MASVELVNNPADGARIHGSELQNIVQAAAGFGVATFTISATVTGSDLNITMPALTGARIPNGTGGLVFVSPSGVAVAFSSNSGNFARTDILCLNDAGSYQVVEGTPAEETGTRAEAPEPDLPTDTIMLAKVRFEAGATVIGTDKVFGRAIDVGNKGMTEQPTQITNAHWFVAAGGAVLDTTATWTTANAAVYTPIRIHTTITVRKLYHKNGATVGTDNVDVGLYDVDSDGLPRTRLTSSGPTATSGANVWQEFDVTDVTIQPGLYYLAASMSGTTDTSLRLAAITISLSRDYSMYEELSAGTLPATATPVVYTATRTTPLLMLNRATT